MGRKDLVCDDVVREKFSLISFLCCVCRMLVGRELRGDYGVVNTP